jgi:hypothetical protein
MSRRSFASAIPSIDCRTNELATGFSRVKRKYTRPVIAVTATQQPEEPSRTYRVAAVHKLAYIGVITFLPMWSRREVTLCLCFLADAAGVVAAGLPAGLLGSVLCGCLLDVGDGFRFSSGAGAGVRLARWGPWLAGVDGGLALTFDRALDGGQVRVELAPPRPLPGAPGRVCR